jgi:hypothetical protein
MHKCKLQVCDGGRNESSMGKMPLSLVILFNVDLFDLFNMLTMQLS